MSAEIVDILPKEHRSQEIVDILSRWLEDAQRGDLTSVVLVGITSHGTTATEFSSGHPIRDVVGSLEILKHDILVSAKS